MSEGECWNYCDSSDLGGLRFCFYFFFPGEAVWLSLSEGRVPQCVSVSAHQWGLVSSGSRCKKDRWFHSSPLYSSHWYSDIRATSIWKLIVCHPFTAMFDLSFDTCACFGPVLLPAACYCCCLDTACSTISRFIMWLLKNTSMEKQFLIKVR